jgi:hypothetical protein
MKNYTLQEYGADYSGSFTNRTLVDKQYVDTLITGVGAFAGSHDASAGLLPTTGTGIASAIDKGDYWLVSVAGNITGLTPITQVKIGDVLFAKISGATLAADFFVVQSNVDQATTTVAGIARLASVGDVATPTAALLNTTDIITPNLLSQYVTNTTGISRYTQAVTFVASVGLVITHNLSRKFVVVEVYDATDVLVKVEVVCTSTTQVTLTSLSAFSGNVIIS